MSKKSSIDRRAHRTRTSLTEALIATGGALESVDVGDLTEKAGIGRSTFYAHYASKQDFLDRSFVAMLAMFAAKEPDAILPARHVFAHVQEAGDFARGMLASDEAARMMAVGEAKLRELAEAYLARARADWPSQRRRDAALFIAGGFVALLRKQIETMRAPEENAAAFERLVESVLRD